MLIKPLKDKYHVTSSSTIQNPIRIGSIRNGTTLTQTEKNTVINSLTILIMNLIELMSQLQKMKFVLKKSVTSQIQIIIQVLQLQSLTQIIRLLK